MKVIIMALAISLFAISCETEPLATIDGNYQGLYFITHNYGTDSSYTLQGNVTFEFNSGKYTCIPEKNLLPPSGKGNYILDKYKIVLIDKVGHTSEFDPSLILNGDFYYSFDGVNLLLLQEDKHHMRLHRINLTKVLKN
jgi:hypothetical protein